MYGCAAYLRTREVTRVSTRMDRGGAAATSWIFRGDASRGDAAALSQIVCGGRTREGGSPPGAHGPGSRLRRGYDVEGRVVRDGRCSARPRVHAPAAPIVGKSWCGEKAASRIILKTVELVLGSDPPARVCAATRYVCPRTHACHCGGVAAAAAPRRRVAAAPRRVAGVGDAWRRRKGVSRRSDRRDGAAARRVEALERLKEAVVAERVDRDAAAAEFGERDEGAVARAKRRDAAAAVAGDALVLLKA